MNLWTCLLRVLLYCLNCYRMFTFAERGHPSGTTAAAIAQTPISANSYEFKEVDGVIKGYWIHSWISKGIVVYVIRKKTETTSFSKLIFDSQLKEFYRVLNCLTSNVLFYSSLLYGQVSLKISDRNRNRKYIFHYLFISNNVFTAKCIWI